MKIFSLLVNPEQSGVRLDRVVSGLPEIYSRSRAQKLIELCLVWVNGKNEKSSYLVQEGEEIRVQIPQLSKKLVPLPMDLHILHEDQDVAVIFKPSGLVVHPAAGHEQDTLVNVLLSKIKNLSMGFNEKRPGIVHRIDKETSGLLVVAKNDRAHVHLAEQFRSRSVIREYYALVYGKLKRNSGRIETHIGRDSHHRKRFKSVSDGKIAITNYKTFREFPSGITELRVKLETGRTHQIRVHLSELGHPILGDVLYGSSGKCKQLKIEALRKKIEGLPRIALHAAVLGFSHPTTGEKLNFEMEWPQDITELRQILEDGK